MNLSKQAQDLVVNDHPSIQQGHVNELYIGRQGQSQVNIEVDKDECNHDQHQELY
jgi:hypothetical protein